MSRRLSDYADEDLLRELVRRARNRTAGARFPLMLGNISWSTSTRAIDVPVGKNLRVHMFVHDDVLEFLEKGTASGSTSTEQE